MIINSNGAALVFLEEFTAGGDDEGQSCDDFIIAH